MRLEEQVCSLGLSEKLKELGVKQESAFYWETSDDKLPILVTTNEAFTNDELEYFSAFTVSELGEMLPFQVRGDLLIFDVWNDQWLYYYGDCDDKNYSSTEADARANCLIYLLEQGIIKPGGKN